MRFAVAHKTASYLMVGFAFLALIGGGGMGPLVSYGGLLALIASWWWEAPRIRIRTMERGSWVWTVLTLLVFGYCVLTAIVTLDFLYVGGEFLVWLTIAKAFNRKAARDWQQMYLLAFLMLVAGSVLNPDLTYGLFFFGFVITTTWALTLFHLRREMEDNLLVKHAADRASERVEVRRILDSRRIVGGRFFFGTGLLSFCVFLGAAVVFLALPRIGIGFFLKTHGGLMLVGFSENVHLGDHGVLKQDPTVVMRVEIDPRYGGRSAPEIHWRGVSFDHYENGQWSHDDNAPKTNQTLEAHPTRDRRVLLWTGHALPVPEIERLARKTVKQEVWLEPLDSNVLFAAGQPRIVEYAHTLRRHALVERNDEIRLEHGSTVHYTVYSELSGPSPDELRKGAGSLPAGFEVYTQLPEEITAHTRRLAHEITANAPTQYDKVIAIKKWLNEHLSYTLELEDPHGREPVDYFLFERKAGHCEYFASAFAILARAVHIPTRNVNGFLGGEWNEYQNYIAVRAGDAHSWDEVFFPGVRGTGVWVTIDPTPPGEVDQLGRGGTGWRARLSRFIDTLRFQWTKWVVEYDLVSQLSLFKSIGGALESAGRAIKHAALWVKDRLVDHWPISVPFGALLIALFVRRRWKKRRRATTAGGRVIKPRKRSSVAGAFDDVVRQLAKAGIARPRATTPRELATRLATDGDSVAARVSELVDIYYAAEWGGRREPSDERRATTLAAEIKAELRTRTRASRRGRAA